MRNHVLAGSVILLMALIPSRSYAQHDNVTLSPESITLLQEHVTALEAEIGKLKSQMKKNPAGNPSLENIDPDLTLKPFYHNNGRNRGSGNEAGFDLIADLGFKVGIQDDLSVCFQSRLKSQKCEFSRNYEYEFGLTNSYRPKEEPISLKLGYLSYNHTLLGDYKIGIVPTIFDIDNFYDYRYLCIGPIDSELIPFSDVGIRWDKNVTVNPNLFIGLNLLFSNGEGDAVTNSNSACGAGGSGTISYLFNNREDLFSIGVLAYTGKKYSTPVKELFDVIELQNNMVFKKLRLFQADTGDLEIKNTYSWYRRGFRDEDIDASEIAEYGYSEASENYLVNMLQAGGAGIIDYHAINIDMKYTPPVMKRKFSIAGNYSELQDNKEIQAPFKRWTAGLEIRILESETHTLTFLGYWANTQDDLPKDPSDREYSIITGLQLVMP
ncbi:MAG: hypothetical protein AB1611_18675 [bacterium]